MPRKYIRKEGARRYGYSVEAMSQAVADVKNNVYSIKKASEVYEINRTTLLNHLKNEHDGKIGRPTIRTRQEENLLVHALKKLGECGFGIDREAVN